LKTLFDGPLFFEKRFKMNFSADFIRGKLSGELPGLSSHLKLAPDSRAKQIASYKESKRQAKKSAVMILLFHENEKLKVIFIRRGMYVGIHAGQIAFPGGRFEIRMSLWKYCFSRN
jgi:accessory gene regulator protein AgrB